MLRNITSVMGPAVLLSVVLVSACDHPSPSPTAPSSPAPTPTPTPTPPVPATEVWNITVRLTAASGGECVGDMMQAQMGVPKSYTLSIAQNGSTADVTLRSASGDYACTFPARMEGDGFTTVGVGGFLSCEKGGMVRGYACADGRLRDMQSLGENLSGHITGSAITGEWTVNWMVTEVGGGRDLVGLDTTSQYSGSR
jgi:hypothetical protein